MDRKKTLAVFLVGLVAGLVLISSFSARVAQADFLGDLFKGFHSFFTPATSTPFIVGKATSTPPAVSPYKPVIDYERAVVDAVKRAAPAVVAITISKNVPILENCQASPFGDLPPDLQQLFGDNFPQFTVPCTSGKTKLQEVGGGSGFIISADGLVLTNKHVASDPAASYTVFTNDGKKYDAKVLARDPIEDLAVLKINATGLPTVTLGDSGALELGQTAIAIGNALGEFRNTVSVGVISGLARTVTASGPEVGAETIQGVIQTDAAINPGNSGGPLLNLAGEVVGINTAIASGAQNIGFAIPINQAKRAIASVLKTGEIEAPFLGVRYMTITPDLAVAQKLSVDYGALVRGDAQGPAVTPGSPADKAGIKAEDVITEVNGEKIDADHPLGELVAEHGVGDTVTLTVHRGTQTLTLAVVLAKRPKT